MKYKIFFILLSFIITDSIFVFSCSEKDSPTTSHEDQQKYSPSAQFSANPKSGEAPLLVSFDASASSDQDGEIVSYSWDFGDNSSSGFGVTTEHTYQSEGNYLATLVVTDNDNNESSASVQINTTAAPGPTMFPMYKDARWVYDVEVYYKPLTENSGSTEYGKIIVVVSEYDSVNFKAKLTVNGDLEYFTDNYFPITIPEQIYIREKENILERAESATGPWETTMNFSVSSWTNGGLILAGSNYRAFSLKTSSKNTSAGSFSGYLVGAQEDNWGESYTTDDHEYFWKEFFNFNYGLIWSEYYSYYDDKADMYGPSETRKEVTLTGYSIPLPDGTVLEGGTDIPDKIIVDCIPGVPYPASSVPTVDDRNAQIQLQFSQDMDKNSVKDAFSVGVNSTPKSIPMTFSKSGSIQWSNNKKCTWIPDNSFSVHPPRYTYVFAKLDGSAKSASGTQLYEDIIFIFAIK